MPQLLAALQAQHGQSSALQVCMHPACLRSSGRLPEGSIQHRASLHRMPTAAEARAQQLQRRHSCGSRRRRQPFRSPLRGSSRQVSAQSSTEAPAAGDDAAGQRTAVVTGASSGIGRATALLLAHQGWRVFAGVRSAADAAAASKAHPNVTPLQLDVTNEAGVAAAAQQVEAAVGGRGLDALVNNAGRAMTAPVEFLPLHVLREQLEVNLVGMVAVTQRFLPLLRAGRPGRIVNVGSQSGTVALPMFAPYACSKFGVEALSDCLRLELQPQGIEVCLVSPGAVRTPIWGKSTADADALLAAAPPAAERLYGCVIRQVQAGAAHAEAQGVTAETVAAVIADTLTAPQPRTRQVVGAAAAVQMAVRRLLPDRLWDRLLMDSLAKRQGQAAAASLDATSR